MKIKKFKKLKTKGEIIQTNVGITQKKRKALLLKEIKFDRQGLISAIIQDVHDNSVLMVAYMNRGSLKKTLSSGATCFWSRSRKELWVKGRESGNRQLVKEVYLDCDGDSLLLKVEQKGGAACHTGYRSCFYRRVTKDGKLKIVGKKVFDPKDVYFKKVKKR